MTMKRYVVWTGLAVAAVSALAMVVHRMPSADEQLMAHDQEVIDGWPRALGHVL